MLESGSDRWVSYVRGQPAHDVVDGVAPLAEGNEIVEAFEHHILVIEVRAVFAVLHPIPGEGLFGGLRLSGCDVGKSFIDP
ncbi:hypothetical protein D3C85_1379380 [compost metagenome]